jgi:hypothetical protein
MNLTWKNLLAICLIATAVSAAVAQTVQTDPYKPPRYWSTYEYNITLQHFGVCYNFIPEYALQANVDWVHKNLQPFGYNIIQIDGWGDSQELNQNGYRTTHSKFWHHDYAWWSAYLQSRGMQLGIYENPLWIHVPPTDTTTKIVGTDINVSSLIDNSGNSGTSPTPPATGPSQNTASPNAANSCGLTGSSPSNTSFTWVDVNKPGAEQYVKGYVKFYADMGVKFIKVDFMAWYETGFDHYLGRVGPPHSHQDYVTAMRWIREACDQNGVYFALTMANLFNEAQVERQYAHSIRVDEDVDYGEWYKFSDKNRGQRFPLWSQWANAMDGFTYWSYLSGQDRVRLDGDFIRMNTYATDSERRTAISAHVLAGGLIGPTDQFNTIGNSVWVYQNPELLALNADDFVGKPLTNDPTNQASQIWSGKTSNGDTILGLFNRELNTTMRSVNFSDIGVPGSATVSDLWQHADLGQMSSVSVNLPPHGSIVLKLSNKASTCTPQSITFNPIGDWAFNQPPPSVSVAASSGLPVQFEVAFGPAITQANQVQPTGQPGTVFVVAKQPGNKTVCAAMPQVQSFEANGPHQDNMFLFGTFTNWTPIRMKFEGGVWVAHNVPISAGNQQLKFANTNNFTGADWGDAQGLSGTATVTTGGKPNLQITSPESAYYRATFDDVTLQYAFQIESRPAPGQPFPFAP